MKAKEAWVIVPFSRPLDFNNTISNFIRQNFLNKKLIIVENGKAIGCCKSYNFEPDVLLTSGPHQSLAKNEAINYIRKNSSNGYFICHDSDDYYGGNYISEMVEASDKAELVGKSDIFIKMASGNLRLFQGLGSNEYVFFIHGPTICSWAELNCEFPMVEKIGEDCRMVERMISNGAKVWATSKYNFMYVRNPDPNHNTWAISDEELTTSLAMGAGRDERASIKDFGPVDLDIVNGIMPEPMNYTTINATPNYKAELAKYDDGVFEDFMKMELIRMGMADKNGNIDKLDKIGINVKLWNTFREGFVQEAEDLS